MSTISQLDFLLMGRRGLPQRLAAIEGSLRSIALSADSTGAAPETAQEVRANLLVNSSFELYDRGTTLPNNWTTTGSLSTAAQRADGATTLLLDPGETAVQTLSAGAQLVQGAVVVSVNVRTSTAGFAVGLSLAHTPGVTAGTLYRLGDDGLPIETSSVPADGQWYRFYRSFLLVGGGTAQLTITATGSSGQLEVDAVKAEKVDGSNGYIEPTAYISADWGAATHIRNLSAVNIVTGTLAVGGSASTNPSISVRNGSDVEIVTIGAPVSGYYGIRVANGAGIRVEGTGDLEVLSGGDIVVSGGGDINVTGGNVNVTSGGVFVSSTGVIRAGTAGAARTELAAGGLYGYNSSNVETVRLDSSDGLFKISGSGSVQVTGGGSILAGTPGAARLEIKSTGIFAYNSSNVETVSISTTDGILRISATAFVVTGQQTFDALAVSGAVTVGQDLTVGANVLFVDQSQSNVGINRAPDTQFDLDVNGNFRAGGYIVGRHAIQLDGADFIAHYDGPPPLATDTTGDLRGHLGQIPTVVGSVLFRQGRFGKAIELQSGATLTYPAVNNITPASGTISVWVYVGSTGSQTILNLRNDTNTSSRIRLRINTTAQFALEINGVTATDTTTVLATSTWYHLVATWTSGSSVLYVNGVQRATAAPAGWTTYAANFYVGTYYDGTGRWTGRIDDLAILGRVATAAEVRAIYESNAPVFAETSVWSWRTANTLAWADAEGLWAVDSGGAPAFGVVGVDGKSWATLTLDRGDVLIGNATQNIRWDASAGTLSITGNGSGLTSINGGNIQTGTITATQLSATAIDAMTITGATIRTAASGLRAELTSAGLTLTPVTTAGAGFSSQGGSRVKWIRDGTSDESAYIYANNELSARTLYLVSNGLSTSSHNVQVYAQAEYSNTGAYARMRLATDSLGLSAGFTVGDGGGNGAAFYYSSAGGDDFWYVESSGLRVGTSSTKPGAGELGVSGTSILDGNVLVGQPSSGIAARLRARGGTLADTDGATDYIAAFSSANGAGEHVGIQIRSRRNAAGTGRSAHATLIQRFYDSTFAAPYLSFTDAGRIGINVLVPSYELQLSTDSAGKPGTSTWAVVSDARTKHNDTRPFALGLDWLEGVTPVYYRYNGRAGTPADGPEYVGLIAQDAPKELVRKITAQLDEGGGFEEILTTSIDPLIYALVNAVKELRAEIAKLKEKLK